MTEAKTASACSGTDFVAAWTQAGRERVAIRSAALSREKGMEPLVFTTEKNVKRFIWNLTANVGPAQPNKLEDVHFVQLSYYAMANNAKNPPRPELRAIYAAVKPGAAFTGREDDPLIRAIRAHQKARGGMQDGRISVMRGNFYHMSDGPHTFMVTALNNNLVDMMPDDYPRLDKHPICPQAVRDAVRSHCLPPG
jgi:hypothetical protein